MGFPQSGLVTMAIVAVVVAVALFRLVNWYRSRCPRLRLLTGTTSQQRAILLAVRPVVRNLLPTLESTGVEVSVIALLPTLTGSSGEPLQAQVEQVNDSRSFSIRLAHWVSGTLRRPEEVAGALAEELLGLYRDAAAVTVVRQTPATVSTAVLVTAEKMAGRKDGRPAVATLSRAAARDEAEGTVVAFRPNPLGTSPNGHAS
jgi:hypothetical protein